MGNSISAFLLYSTYINVHIRCADQRTGAAAYLRLRGMKSFFSDHLMRIALILSQLGVEGCGSSGTPANTKMRLCGFVPRPAG